jgi:uncharacterized DUF497 family protein
MKYDWDDTKNALNIKNRGLDFALMKGFDWASALCGDIQNVDGEERELWIGLIGLTLHTVIVTERDNWNEEAGYG